MNVALLTKIFGKEQHWHGPCTVILDSEASIQAVGTDSIVGAGAKVFAPRLISGRVQADCVCLLADGTALMIVQQQRTRQQTGDEVVKQTLVVADTTHVVAIEFLDTAPLLALGLPVPTPRTTGSHSGVHTRPKTS